VAPVRVHSEGDDGVVREFTQRWTYALPLELVWLTPLHSWNPHDIAYHGSHKGGTHQQVVATKATHDGAIDGTHSKLYYRTPSELFADSNGPSGGDGDPADTTRRGQKVLDTEGGTHNCEASGVRIVMDGIPGVTPFHDNSANGGGIRTRYPIMPIHEGTGRVWEKLEAAESMLLREREQAQQAQQATEATVAQLERSALVNEEQSQLQILQLQQRIEAIVNSGAGTGGSESSTGVALKLVEVENMLLGLDPEVDTDCYKGNGKRGKAYLTDGVTVQPPHSNGVANRYANSDYWASCENNAANAEAKFELEGLTSTSTSSPNFVTEVHITHRCDAAKVARRRGTGIKVFVGVADGSEVQCGRSDGLEASAAEFCTTTVVHCGLVANAVYVAVRGNGDEPLNLVEVQAKGKVARPTTASADDEGVNRRSRSLSQHGAAVAGTEQPHAQQQQQQQQQHQQPSTAMAALVGGALGMMAIVLAMALVRAVRARRQAPLLPAGGPQQQQPAVVALVPAPDVAVAV